MPHAEHRGARWRQDQFKNRVVLLARREAAAPQVKDDCVVGLQAFCAVDGAEVGLNAPFPVAFRRGHVTATVSVAAQGQNRQSAAGTASANACHPCIAIAVLVGRPALAFSELFFAMGYVLEGLHDSLFLVRCRDQGDCCCGRR